MSKIYFIDTGLRNIIIKNMSAPNERVDAGALIENSILSQFLKNLLPLQEIHFWRTLAKNEVDFVLIEGNLIMLIEVKYTTFKSPKVPLGIRYFQRDYKTDKSIVLTKDYFGRADNTIFLPWWLG